MADGVNEEINQVMLEAMQNFSEAFDKLCQDRHEAGAAEYGKFTFLQNDVVRMMMEELADTSNYCRMQFIKLMFLQQVLEEDLIKNANEDGDINFGAQSFKGVGDVGWSKP